MHGAQVVATGHLTAKAALGTGRGACAVQLGSATSRGPSPSSHIAVTSIHRFIHPRSGLKGAELHQRTVIVPCMPLFGVPWTVQKNVYVPGSVNVTGKLFGGDTGAPLL